jgi:hypothetical protein
VKKTKTAKPTKKIKNTAKPRSKAGAGFDHQCDWREAAIKLARCVVMTLQTNGKIGVGSGMVMSVVDGKRVIERWDKDFIEALAFIGIEMTDKKPDKSRRGRGGVTL